MCTCIYCHKQFTPRAQVKNPKACSNRRCQKKRQRDNEKDWRKENPGLTDGKYHALRRSQRLSVIRERVERFCKSAEVGLRFFKEHFELAHFKEILFGFFRALGVKRVNKLWCEGI